MKNYAELLHKMTMQELRAENKSIGISISGIFREYFGSTKNMPSWDIDELDILYAKRDAITHEARMRIAEGRI